MKNYRTIELPDCCASCLYFSGMDGFACMVDEWSFDYSIEPNGLCDDFEREGEE